MMMSPTVPTMNGGTDISVASTPEYPIPAWTIRGRNVVKAVTGFSHPLAIPLPGLLIYLAIPHVFVRQPGTRSVSIGAPIIPTCIRHICFFTIPPAAFFDHLCQCH